MQKRFWNHIEKMLPDQARGAMQRVRGRVDRLRLSRMSRRDAFTTIYAEAMWDESSNFQVLDIVAEALPVVDVIMIRQVLQHLSNDDIAQALESIRRSCRHLILTEHVPAGRDFPPNADHERGATIRLYKREPSGVVLTAPPFNLVPKHEAVLCEIPYGHPGEVSVIRTIAYEL